MKSNKKFVWPQQDFTPYHKLNFLVGLGVHVKLQMVKLQEFKKCHATQGGGGQTPCHQMSHGGGGSKIV